MRKTLLCCLSFFLLQCIKAQTIAINTTGTTGDASSMLDVSSSTKGLLVPRMSTTQISNIASPAKGLLVFDSTVNQFKVNMGTGALPNWQALTSNATGWTLNGNSGTNAAGSFIGTTDGIPFNIRVNNHRAGFIDSASKNTFLGYRSGDSSKGFYNTSTGYQALFSNTTGVANTGNGVYALFTNTDGYFNTAHGYQSLYGNTSGDNNTANGYTALYGNTTGRFNTATGSGSLYANATGNFNTAVGGDAMTNNVTGSYNVATGVLALSNNASGSYNVATGANALRSNETGFSNVANGAFALSANTSGSENVANGDSALLRNTTGTQNTANGFYALSANTTGSNNTAQGSFALPGGTGWYNTADGASALSVNTSGQYNAAVGAGALGGNSSGSSNSALGESALSNNSSGSNNTGLGALANIGTSSVISNTTVIGANAYATQSNSIILGSISGVNFATASTNVGIGTTAPAHTLDIQGNSIFGGQVQLRLHETQADYARMKFTNTATTNFWDMAVLPTATGNNAGAEVNFYYSGFGGNVLGLKGNGNLVIQGTLTQSSDARLKKNITPLTGSLEKIVQLNGYAYAWKDERRDPEPQIGVLAQEVAKVFPELVKQDEKGLLSVSYNGLIPVLIEAIKTQQAQIELLKKQVSLLSSK